MSGGTRPEEGLVTDVTQRDRSVTRCHKKSEIMKNYEEIIVSLATKHSGPRG